MATKKKVPVKKSTKKRAPRKKEASKPPATPAPISGGSLLTELHDEISNVFERFSEGFPWSWPSTRALKEFGFPGALASPKVDFSESDDAYEVTTELPGLDENDIEVSVTDHMLSIKGEKRDERDVEEKDFHLSERSYGAFRRSFTLPEGVDTGKADAAFEKGVLTIHLPKTREVTSKRRKITVKQGK
jgi:HSP20 family protein